MNIWNRFYIDRLNILYYLTIHVYIVLQLQFSLKKMFIYLQPIPNADFVVPVEIDGTVHQVYVLKRPYVDEFLKKMGELYECVLFTASLAKYADPVADLLDK